MSGGEQIGLANRMKLAFLLLLLPLAGLAKELYSTRDLSEKEIVQMYQRVLLEGCQHADQFWHAWPGAPGAGYWGNGKSVEEGNRANSGMLVASAALLKYSRSLPAAERRELLRKTLASLLRLIFETETSLAIAIKIFIVIVWYFAFSTHLPDFVYRGF